jgi:hypothetical protein
MKYPSFRCTYAKLKCEVSADIMKVNWLLQELYRQVRLILDELNQRSFFKCVAKILAMPLNGTNIEAFAHIIHGKVRQLSFSIYMEMQMS